jgi:serine/threonine-protein kinase
MSCDLPEVSKEVFRKIVAANPTYRDTVEILGALEVELMSEAMEAFGEVVQQDEAFRGQAGSTTGASALNQALPELPDLPELPELPQAEAPGAPIQGEALPSPTVSTLAQMPPQAPAQMTHPPELHNGIPHGPPPTEGAPTSQPYSPGAAAPTVGLTHETANAVAPVTVGMGGVVPLPPPQATPDALPQPGAPQATPDALPQPGAPQATPGGMVALQPGALIADRYRLEAELGKGGSASVFRALDLELDDEVALKFLAKPRENPADFERFRRELKLTRQLTHPNVIRVHDIGVHQQYSYLSMELLKGKSLFELMLDELDLVDGLTYLIQACAGLQAAHDVGVVHRDVKPGNIFITEDEVAKVMDFGIARQRHVPGVTMHGRTFGTPEYMAPEQIRSGSDVTTATDLYALGVTLYEVCTGQVPFQHPEAMPLMMMHLEQLPRPPRELAPGLPASLEQVILQLLEKEPSQRIPSCSALARRLRQIRQEYRNAQR